MLVNIHISGHSYSVGIHLPKKLFPNDGNLRVVVERYKDTLRIREASQCEDGMKVNITNNIVTYTHQNARDLLGKWIPERDGDYYYLIRI